MIGNVDVISRTRIAGWAADPTRPKHEVAVRVVVNGRATRVIANLPREDLKALFPRATGCYGFELDSGIFPLSPFVDNVVEAIFIATGASVPGGISTLKALGKNLDVDVRKGRLRPIVVYTTGRTGSSLLMARLARHPNIVVAREHPYELKLLSYYAYAYRTLVSEADRHRSSNPDTLAAPANRFFIGFNPFNDERDSHDPALANFWHVAAPDALRTCFVSLVDDYYQLVAKQTGKTKPILFVEKIGSSDLVREGTAFMFGPMYEILLVRDPRDIICSSKSFWQRAFIDSVKVLRSQFIAMERPRREAGQRQHLLRYEDLLLRPHATMAELFAFLEVPVVAVEPDAAAEADVFKQHGTSQLPGDTIERWRRELIPEQIEIANSELGPFIEKYGYALS